MTLRNMLRVEVTEGSGSVSLATNNPSLDRRTKFASMREQEQHEDDGGALALGIMAFLGALWAADESDKADQLACMNKCSASRERCVELCTQ